MQEETVFDELQRIRFRLAEPSKNPKDKLYTTSYPSLTERIRDELKKNWRGISDNESDTAYWYLREDYLRSYALANDYTGVVQTEGIDNKIKFNYLRKASNLVHRAYEDLKACMELFPERNGLVNPEIPYRQSLKTIQELRDKIRAIWWFPDYDPNTGQIYLAMLRAARDGNYGDPKRLNDAARLKDMLKPHNTLEEMLEIVSQPVAVSHS